VNLHYSSCTVDQLGELSSARQDGDYDKNPKCLIDLRHSIFAKLKHNTSRNGQLSTGDRSEGNHEVTMSDCLRNLVNQLSMDFSKQSKKMVILTANILKSPDVLSRTKRIRSPIDLNISLSALPALFTNFVNP